MLKEDFVVEQANESKNLIDKETTYPQNVRGVFFFIRLACFWFAYSGMAGALPSVVWPSQIETLVGQDNKEEFNGILPALGAFVSLVITPVAGMLSDRSTSKFGRRRIFIVPGILTGAAFLLLMGFFGKEGSNKWLFMLLTAGLRLGIDWAAGPYAGLLPDTVMPSQRGAASGYNGLAQVIGYLVGLVAAGLLTEHNNYWKVYLCLTIIFVVFSLPTIFGISEQRLSESVNPITLRDLLRSFYLDPKLYKSFYWVIATRGMEQMGYYSVLPFFQFFVQDVLKLQNPEFYSSVLFVCILVTSVPSSVIAGRLSDRYDKKFLVYLSTGLMALMMIGLVFLSLFLPNLYALGVIGAIFGVGYGSFLAVDWALALDALPPEADIAKDMGIWHISFALPQVIAPIIAGLILSSLKIISMRLAYATVFAIASLWFVLSTIFVSKVSTTR